MLSENIIRWELATIAYLIRTSKRMYILPEWGFYKKSYSSPILYEIVNEPLEYALIDNFFVQCME